MESPSRSRNRVLDIDARNDKGTEANDPARREVYSHSVTQCLLGEESLPWVRKRATVGREPDRVVRGVPLRVIQNVVKRAVESFFGGFVEGNQNYERVWSEYEKRRKPLRLRLVSDFLS